MFANPRAEDGRVGRRAWGAPSATKTPAGLPRSVVDGTPLESETAFGNGVRVGTGGDRSRAAEHFLAGVRAEPKGSQAARTTCQPSVGVRDYDIGRGTREIVVASKH